jgi:serine protease Do
MRPQPVSISIGAWIFCALLQGAPGFAAEDRSTPAESAETGVAATVDDLLDRVARWVVPILVQRRADENSVFDDRPVSDRRGRRNPQPPPEVRNYFMRPEGYASGVMVDGDGHILTTHYNVVGEIESISVRLRSGKNYDARVVALSLPDDLALLKIDAPPEELEEFQGRAPWGSSQAVRPGNMVFVAGRSPEPDHLTVTSGIVSAVSRNAGRALQTDAELNYGNVGGPIVNLRGEIIAIASFVGHTRPQWGINSGIGFGTKVDTILHNLPRMRRGEDIKWAFLGVGEHRGPPPQKGMRVGNVRDGTAAGRAGLAEGDIIVEFDGRPIKNFTGLRRAVFARNVGDEVTLKIQRDGQWLDLKITLGERDLRDEP